MSGDGYRIGRKEAVGMESIIRDYIRDMKLSQGLNRQRVFAAWEEVSGAARFTLGKEFQGGVLTVWLSSSVVRDQLYFQRDTLLSMLSDALAQDPLFDAAGGSVKSIVLR